MARDTDVPENQRCEAKAGGQARWAHTCSRKAVGTFDTTIHNQPMRLCAQHRKMWANVVITFTPRGAMTFKGACQGRDKE